MYIVYPMSSCNIRNEVILDRNKQRVHTYTYTLMHIYCIYYFSTPFVALCSLFQDSIFKEFVYDFKTCTADDIKRIQNQYNGLENCT